MVVTGFPNDSRLEKAHGEVAQEQLLVAATRVHLLESIVENVDELTVPLLHGDAHSFAEILGVKIGPAAELAAAIARDTVDPKREANAIAEHEIDCAFFQGLLRVVGGIECRNRGAGEE